MSWPLAASAKCVCLAVSGAFLLSLLATPVNAQNTILVPGNYPTIQAAINAASNGDTVLVSPGTYVENINVNGKAITVTSSNGPLTTIIDGNHNGTVVTFNHSETAASVLSGFTIRNGFQNGGFGGGISISSASPTVSSNLITGNHAATGIGIFVNGGSSLIKNNTISNNDQTGAGSGGSGGGGILVFGASSGTVQIIANTITNNSLLSGGQGGGISSAGGGALLQGNLISGNAVYNDGGGITAYNISAPLTIVENVIVNNTALTGKGGGMNLLLPSSSASVLVTNNTIANNTAYANTSGIYTTGFAQSATLANNIVVAPAGQNPVTCDGTYSTVSPTFSHNDAYSIGSSSSGFFGFCVAGSSGNFSADPLFLSAANNDFHLAVASPAIDAGDSSSPNLPVADFDGNPRITAGNTGGAAAVDLGAFEMTPTSSSTITPAQLSFAALAVESTSPPQTASLTATGATSSQITSVQISGDFAQTNNCPQLIAPLSPQSLPSGTSCSFTVAFTPTIPGPRNGTLTINQSNGTSLTLPLSGTGAPGPIGSLSVSSLAFTEAVGDSSVNKLVTLSNLGNAPLTISSVTTSGTVFSQTNDCGTSLAAGAVCSISVTFTASASNTYTGELDILDTPDTLSYAVSLSGTAVDFSINPSISSLSLSPGSAVQEIIALKSSGGNYPYTVSLSCSGLPGNASCTFGPATAIVGSAPNLTIYGQSQVAVGTFPVTITGVSGNGATRSAQIQLTVKPSIVLSATSLTFSAQAVGNASTPSSVTLTNNSTGNFPLSFIGASGRFLMQSNNCPSSLPPNSSCTVSVSFLPQTYGPAAGSLSIMDTIDSSSYSVALSGTGVDFSLTPSANSTNLLAGSTVQIPVTVTAQGGLYTNSVALSCTGLPANTACSFSPAAIQSGFSSITSTMTIASQSLAVGGTYSITITGGTSFGRTNVSQFQLTILKPSIVLSTSSLNYPFQAVGSTSSGTNVTLINNGAGPFNFTSIATPTSFTQTNNCPSVLAVNSSCSVNVAFDPVAYGQASGGLSIQDNVDGLSYSVALGGVGVDFSVSTSPAAATVIRGNSAGFIVSVSPLGGPYAKSVAFSCSGLPAGAACAFSSQAVLPGSSGSAVNLTITTDQKVVMPGTYLITVLGSSSATHTSQIQVTVTKNKNN
jgi:uncharacterized membrane protein